MKNSSALLGVKNLSINIRRGKKLLSSVEDISFDVYPGEVLGIAGESGSGKSLTALSIAGLLDANKKVTQGSIIFHGSREPKDLLTLGEKEMRKIRGKEISMIFQEPFSSLNPLMKVGAQIAEALELHGEKNKDSIQNRVIDIMKRLALPEPEKLAETYPHRLSGGMCQRVMIALAMICRPRLLIADEPTTALDSNTQSQILSMMKEINKELGVSIILISHDLGVIKEICGRVLVIYSGRILEEGSTEAVFSAPAHEYTKGLLGSIPTKEKRGKALVNIPGKVPSLEEGRPQGCPFHPRCAKAMPVCKTEFSAWREIDESHRTRCIIQEKNDG